MLCVHIFLRWKFNFVLWEKKGENWGFVRKSVTGNKFLSEVLRFQCPRTFQINYEYFIAMFSAKFTSKINFSVRQLIINCDSMKIACFTTLIYMFLRNYCYWMNYLVAVELIFSLKYLRWFNSIFNKFNFLSIFLFLFLFDWIFLTVYFPTFFINLNLNS